MADKTVTFTANELAAIPPGQLENLLAIASRVEASAVVRDADGNVRYDDPSLAGQFGEAHLEEGAHDG